MKLIVTKEEEGGWSVQSKRTRKSDCSVKTVRVGTRSDAKKALAAVIRKVRGVPLPGL